MTPLIPRLIWLRKDNIQETEFEWRIVCLEDPVYASFYADFGEIEELCLQTPYKKFYGIDRTGNKWLDISTENASHIIRESYRISKEDRLFDRIVTPRNNGGYPDFLMEATLGNGIKVLFAINTEFEIGDGISEQIGEVGFEDLEIKSTRHFEYEAMYDGLEIETENHLSFVDCVDGHSPSSDEEKALLYYHMLLGPNAGNWDDIRMDGSIYVGSTEDYFKQKAENYVDEHIENSLHVYIDEDRLANDLSSSESVVEFDFNGETYCFVP